MYVINTFSNQKYSKLTEIDLLAWLISLMHYKKLGYITKLYCLPEDLTFLENSPILFYYDEIDTDTFSLNKELSMINNKEFWFWRKIVAIEHEFNLGHEFFYSDTDVIVNKNIDFSNCDLFVWCEEECNKKRWKQSLSVYVDWGDISWPEGYKMPNYIRKTRRDNFNCGLLWFKERSIFDLWKKEMLAFILNNPCTFIKVPKFNINAVFACNTEQRFLKGIANHLKLNVKVFDNAITSTGIAPGGVHLFYWRSKWCFLKNDFIKNSFISDLWTTQENSSLVKTVLMLCDFVRLWIEELQRPELYFELNYFINIKYIREILEFDDKLKYILNNYKKERFDKEANDEELLAEYEKNLAELNNC